MHYRGYAASRQNVLNFTRHQLIDLIESLYGWDWSEDGIAEDRAGEVGIDRLRDEALLQHSWEWTIPAGQESHCPDAEE